jgi:hypothetical protein
MNTNPSQSNDVDFKTRIPFEIKACPKVYQVSFNMETHQSNLEKMKKDFSLENITEETLFGSLWFLAKSYPSSCFYVEECLDLYPLLTATNDLCFENQDDAMQKAQELHDYNFNYGISSILNKQNFLSKFIKNTSKEKVKLNKQQIKTIHNYVDLISKQKDINNIVVQKIAYVGAKTQLQNWIYYNVPLKRKYWYLKEDSEGNKEPQLLECLGVAFINMHNDQTKIKDTWDKNEGWCEKPWNWIDNDSKEINYFENDDLSEKTKTQIPKEKMIYVTATLLLDFSNENKETQNIENFRLKSDVLEKLYENQSINIPEKNAKLFLSKKDAMRELLELYTKQQHKIEETIKKLTHEFVELIDPLLKKRKPKS